MLFEPDVANSSTGKNESSSVILGKIAFSYSEI